MCSPLNLGLRKKNYYFLFFSSFGESSGKIVVPPKENLYFHVFHLICHGRKRVLDHEAARQLTSVCGDVGVALEG
jgi:hypothetical protein